MGDSQQILNDLHGIRRKGYDEELPGKHDAQFMELAEIYAASEPEEREAIRGAVQDETRMLLLGFGDRMAILADRTGTKRYVLLALLAHAIEDFRYDPRENIFRLTLANHVAAKLGVEAGEIFEQAAGLASDKGAASLRAFDRRPAALKTLRTMGIVEYQTEAGPDYRYE
ncbi:MAG: hypothetical protein K0U98_24430 [Deltaproteobacteria bacterium]|nr:hypothetical protein [Deltaproteobacteria bacterium]